MRAFIPEELRGAYLTAFHDHFGHGGRERTYRLMSMHVYWPRMYHDVDAHVRACHECAFTKRPTRVPGQGHEPSIGDIPFDTVVVDVLSMGEVQQRADILRYWCSLTLSPDGSRQSLSKANLPLK